MDDPAATTKETMQKSAFNYRVVLGDAKIGNVMEACSVCRSSISSARAAESLPSGAANWRPPGAHSC